LELVIWCEIVAATVNRIATVDYAALLQGAASAATE
jgi:hypothetical protein